MSPGDEFCCMFAWIKYLVFCCHVDCVLVKCRGGSIRLSYSLFVSKVLVHAVLLV